MCAAAFECAVIAVQVWCLVPLMHQLSDRPMAALGAVQEASLFTCPADTCMDDLSPMRLSMCTPAFVPPADPLRVLSARRLRDFADTCQAEAQQRGGCPGHPRARRALAAPLRYGPVGRSNRQQHAHRRGKLHLG